MQERGQKGRVDKRQRKGKRERKRERTRQTHRYTARERERERVYCSSAVQGGSVSSAFWWLAHVAPGVAVTLYADAKSMVSITDTPGRKVLSAAARPGVHQSSPLLFQQAPFVVF